MPVRCKACGSAARRLQVLRVLVPAVRGCLYLVNAVCCQVEVSATGRSLVRGSPTECGVSECDLKTSSKVRPRLTTATDGNQQGQKQYTLLTSNN